MSDQGQSDPPQSASDQQQTGITPEAAPNTINPNASQPAMFATKPAEGADLPITTWVIAGVVVLAVIVSLIFFGRRKPSAPANTIQPLAAYAANLPMSQFAMSDSTSLSGFKSTFVDGHIHNSGSKTVTGITVQVIFRNDENLPPQIETLPLTLIRTRQPYIDTEPLSAAPLKPGDDQDFRLIFESIPDNWNFQMPEVRIIHITPQ